MKTSLFDYALDPSLIAQYPPPDRAASRMLIVSRKTGTLRDSVFAELPEILSPSDVLVLNNSRVIPARLLGRKVSTGGKCELLLVGKLDDKLWNCLANPARSLRLGTRIEFGEQTLFGAVVAQRENGIRTVQFECEGDFRAVLEAVGHTPLPPYIKREESVETPQDKERYQTVFARQDGSVAAPTAGLHFTKAVLQAIEKRGIQIVEITHHVGLATFLPVKEEKVERHALAAERFEIDETAATILNRAKREQRRIIAVGTTATRALESATTAEGKIASGSAETFLFIYPGYEFRTVSGLLTNFHLPRSTLLMLVSAFLSRELSLAAYMHAVDRKYRFYSYGDCMLCI